ncbi:MAG: YcxB family protein [Planctomycetes bacterium]|nr:YcxB family protein [Planctomycetota bacterium]
MHQRSVIQAQIQRSDWIEVNRALIEQSPHWAQLDRQYRRQRNRFLIAAFPLTIAGVSLFIGRAASTSGMYYEGAAIGLLLWAFIALATTTTNTHKLAKQNELSRVERADYSSYVGGVTVGIDPGGIDIAHESKSLRIAWRMVTIREAAGSFVFSCGADGAIIPRRAFSSPHDADAFITQARAWWQTGQLAPEEHLARYLSDRDLPCPKCRYNLRGARGTACPECATPLSVESLAGT